MGIQTFFMFFLVAFCALWMCTGSAAVGAWTPTLWMVRAGGMLVAGSFLAILRFDFLKLRILTL